MGAGGVGPLAGPRHSDQHCRFVASYSGTESAATVLLAGVVAFPALRGRYILVLVLAILCSPLLWLVALAVLS